MIQATPSLTVQPVNAIGLTRALRGALVLTAATAALMPSVPDPLDPRAIAFVVSFVALMSLWAVRRAYAGTLHRSHVGVALAVFLALVAMSAPIALIFETSLSDWFRGAVPFFFLVVFFPGYELARRNPRWVLDALGVAAILWLASTLMTSASAVPAVLQGDVQRITHAVEAWWAYQLPYAMVGLAMVLFSPTNWLGKARWPLAAMFTLMPVLAVSRGQIAAVSMLWAVYLLRQRGKRRIRALGAALLAAAIVGPVIWTSELQTAIGERFAVTASEQHESSRLAEIRYALDQFVQSPVFGKGLGHQIPAAAITFGGDWELAAAAGVDTVGYMHNVAAYLLMNLGALGLAAYAAFIVPGLRAGWRLRGTSPEAAAALAALVCLLWWFSIQPSFRHVQSNLLLAMLVAVLVAMRQPFERAKRA